MSSQAVITPMDSGRFRKAFLLNLLWVNVSGLPRYFLLVKPMLHAAAPDNPDIAPVSIAILLSWAVWTLGFVLVTSGFYWMYFDRLGNTTRNIVVAAIWATIATIGLTWLGIVNMGMVPVAILLAAVSWAGIEQIVSAAIVSRVMK